MELRDKIICVSRKPDEEEVKGEGRSKRIMKRGRKRWRKRRRISLKPLFSHKKIYFYCVEKQLRYCVEGKCCMDVDVGHKDKKTM